MTNGRYWARTSDLRLVEAKQGGYEGVVRGTKRSIAPGHWGCAPPGHSDAFPLIPSEVFARCSPPRAVSPPRATALEPSGPLPEVTAAPSIVAGPLRRDKSAARGIGTSSGAVCSNRRFSLQCFVARGGGPHTAGRFSMPCPTSPQGREHPWGNSSRQQFATIEKSAPTTTPSASFIKTFASVPAFDTSIVTSSLPIFGVATTAQFVMSLLNATA